MFRIVALILIGISSNLSSLSLEEFEKKPNDAKLEQLPEDVKLLTGTDAILWIGSCYLRPFDSSKMTENEKTIALNNGLVKLEDSAKHGEVIPQLMLGAHYLDSNELNKAIFFSLQAAENGSHRGMFLMAKIYHVFLKDQEGCLKWTLLAAAAGSEDAAILLKANRDQIENFDKYESYSYACKSAKQWSEEHPKIFFNFDRIINKN